MHPDRHALRGYATAHAVDPRRVPLLMTALRPFIDLAKTGSFSFAPPPADDRDALAAIASATGRPALRLAPMRLDGRDMDETSFLLNGASCLAFLLDSRYGTPFRGRTTRGDGELSETFMRALGRPLARTFGDAYRERFIHAHGEGFGMNLCANLSMNLGETLYLLTRAAVRADDEAWAALRPLAASFLGAGIPLLSSPHASGVWPVFRG